MKSKTNAKSIVFKFIGEIVWRELNLKRLARGMSGYWKLVGNQRVPERGFAQLSTQQGSVTWSAEQSCELNLTGPLNFKDNQDIEINPMSSRAPFHWAKMVYAILPQMAPCPVSESFLIGRGKKS